MQDMVRAKRPARLTAAWPARLTAAWPAPGLPAAQPAPLLHAARFSHGSRCSVGSQRHAAPACRLVFGARGLAEVLQIQELLALDTPAKSANLTQIFGLIQNRSHRHMPQKIRIPPLKPEQTPVSLALATGEC